MSHQNSCIKTGMDNKLLPQRFPPPWASEWGQDRYGLYMEFDCYGIRQRFRWMMPGMFSMGSPPNESDRELFGIDETQHEVTLGRGFWLADTACTQALWITIMSNNPSGFQNNHDNPVEAVSWLDVQGFIKKLNQLHPDLSARLPTEAEWEYACRAGTHTPFSFGSSITPEQVNYDGNYPYADGKKGIYREKTVPVKSLPPNPWGLYEMHGNVWEWCADWYGEYARQSVMDPPGPDNGTARILRGGSWNSHGSRYVRSTARSWLVPDYRGVGNGFRLALD